MTNTVLIVEDDVTLRRSIAQSVTLHDMEVIVASSYEMAVENIHKNFNGVVLTDMRMKGKDGLDVLRSAQNCDTDLPVILLTGHGDIAMAVRAIKNGAFEFLEKPCHPDHLIRVLKKALRQRQFALRVRQLEKQVSENDIAELEFPGASSAIDNFRAELHKFSQLPVNIHLWGESGSGRLSAARCICRLSINSHTIFEKNLSDCEESLFDALENDQAYDSFIFKNVELATGLQQEKLSEFIDNHIKYRIVTSSIAELGAIPEAQLRKNLYYRLSVAQLEVPPLRTRPEDVLPTFHAVLRQQSEIMALPIPDLPMERFSQLETREWSGNIAELRQHARKVILELDDASGESKPQSLASRMQSHEKSILEDALKRHRGHTANVAEELSIPVKTLYDRLNRYGLKSSRYR